MQPKPVSRVIDIIAKSNSLEEIEANLSAENLLILDLTDSDNQCFVRAFAKGMPTFTLIAQDLTAAGSISDWLLKNGQLSPKRQQEVIEKMEAFNRWPTKKMPD